MAHGFRNPVIDPSAAITPGPPLPVNVNVVNDISLANGSVTLAPGSSIAVNNPVTQVGLNAGANHVGNVAVDNLTFDGNGVLQVNVVNQVSEGNSTVTIGNGTGHIGSVSIDNSVPLSTTLSNNHVVVDGTVATTVSGTVTLANNVVYTYVINQANSGSQTNTVTVTNFPATQNVAVIGNVTVSPHQVSLTSNSVTVSNFPATQAVSGTVGISGNVSVNPHTVTLSSNSVAVSNFPATQPVSIAANVSVNPHTVTLSNNHVVVDTLPAVSGTVSVQGIDQNSSSHTVATDTSGSIVPPTTIVHQSIVSISASTSTTALASNINRLLYTIQLNDTNNVLVSEVGNALTNIGNAGTMIYGGTSAGTLYTPPFVSNTAITVFCANATSIRVTEYSKR